MGAVRSRAWLKPRRCSPRLRAQRTPRLQRRVRVRHGPLRPGLPEAPAQPVGALMAPSVRLVCHREQPPGRRGSRVAACAGPLTAPAEGPEHRLALGQEMFEPSGYEAMSREPSERQLAVRLASDLQQRREGRLSARADAGPGGRAPGVTPRRGACNARSLVQPAPAAAGASAASAASSSVASDAGSSVAGSSAASFAATPSASSGATPAASSAASSAAS